MSIAGCPNREQLSSYLLGTAGGAQDEEIALHLEGRIQAADGLEPVATMDDTDTQVLEALIALGYSIVEAQAALQIIPRDAPDDIETRIRLALQYFSS